MIKDQSAVIKEIYMVLKPGGCLSIKSGFVVRRYPGREKDASNLEKLVRDHAPLELTEQKKGFSIFVKS